MADALAGKVGIENIKSVETVETPQGLMLKIFEYGPDPDILYASFIPVAALATYSELLGIEDPVEVLEALYQARNHEEPEPDPVTRENVWTDAYALLSKREQERENAARQALQEGTRDDPRSPQLRASLAAFHAVHVPIDGGECALDRCRRRTRERLGIELEPKKKPAAMSRSMTRTLSTLKLKSEEDEPLNHVAKEILPLREQIEFHRREFLHELAGASDVNPLRDTTPLEPDYTPEEADPFAAVMRKYST